MADFRMQLFRIYMITYVFTYDLRNTLCQLKLCSRSTHDI